METFSKTILVLFLTSTVVIMCNAGIFFPELTTPRQCFAPTNCDTNFASCTIGLDCLGSILTQCSFGDGGSNGACATFPGTSQVYCECNSCIGLVNQLAYNCKCQDQTTFVCPTGQTLVACTSPLTNATQYSCCGSATC